MSLELKCNVTCLFDPEESQVVQKVFDSPNAFDVASLVAPISAGNAQASVASDKTLLMRQIEDTIGVPAFDQKIRAWMERALRTEVTQALLKKKEHI